VFTQQSRGLHPDVIRTQRPVQHSAGLGGNDVMPAGKEDDAADEEE